ncbi:MAG: glycoside hydrolase family 127 protein [Methanoregulaceae archaeon]|nr:glycoside hydrolase family 127 protein [Methanoregulaceae archaeon]
MPFTSRLQPISATAVRVTDSFWGPWLDRVATVTIPTQYALLESTGRLENLRRAGRREEGGYQGYRFNDSDVYKWLEACAFSLIARPSAENRRLMDQAVEIIAKAQREDGYLNTFVQLQHPGMEWRSLSMLHEMYCGGHLIEAAVAHRMATGNDELMTVAIRFADHVMSIFGPDKRKGTCGHEEIELALLKLARATGQAKYADFARWLVEIRGTRPSPYEAELNDPVAYNLSPAGMPLLLKNGTYSGEYLQDHAPIREHETVVGHAVRAMYLYIAATELAHDQNDEALENALLRGWRNLTERRMYITGGIGPSGDNEGFTHDYDLPNHSAYAETCAAIGLALWGHRLNLATGDASFVEAVERALYNGALAGISLSGDRYFYANPLESRGDHQRPEWYGCACCPPNIARLIGQVGALALAETEDALLVNLPIGLEAQTRHGRVRIESRYPWEGQVTIEWLEVTTADPFALRVRIPEWCADCGFEVVGANEAAEYENGYASVERTWTAGDRVKVEFDMTPQWIEAHPAVLDDLGRVALTRGPLVYALESPDGPVPQRFTVDASAEIEESWSSDLGGVVRLATTGTSVLDSFADGLYSEVGTQEISDAQAHLIPYYAWSNRGPSHMLVWLRMM